MRKTARVPASLLDPSPTPGWHPRSDPRWLEGLALAAILGLAAWLRVTGLGFGLPAVYNPDEIAIMSRALAFAKGDLNPHNFLYPTFYFYVLFAWVGGYFVLARLTGSVASAAEFQSRFFTDPTGIYLAGRSLSVLCGVATVAAVYWLGRRVFGRAAGLVAAALMAVAPFAARDAHYVKHDVPATLLVVLALLAIVRIWPLGSAVRNPRRDTLMAGAACGVAFSTHYYTVFLALPLVWAVWQRDRGEAVRHLVLAGVAAAAVFFALSPFILAEPLTAWRDIVANRQIVVDRATTSGGVLPHAGTYLRMLAADAIGAGAVILAALGLVRAALRAGAENPGRAESPGLKTRASSSRASAAARAPGRGWALLVLLLAFPVAFLLFIGNTMPASRYLNPVLPFVALLAGAAFQAPMRGSPLGRLMLASLAVVAVVQPAMVSHRTNRFFQQADTRTLALAYVERHVPAHASIAVQPYSIPLVQSRDSLLESLERNLGDARRASTKFLLRLALDPYPSPAYRTIFLGDGGLDADKIYVSYANLGDFTALRRLGVQFVAVKRYNRPDPDTRPFLEALEREGRQLAVFSPYRADVTTADAARIEPFLHNTDTPVDAALERPGPLIELWELK